MFYTSNFLTFDRDEMYRKVFYTFNFLERKISLTSKMFYFIYPLYSDRFVGQVMIEVRYLDGKVFILNGMITLNPCPINE